MKNEALKNGLFENLDSQEANELKDSYYNVACSLQPTIEALELALLNEQNNEHPLQANIAALETELRIYKAMWAMATTSQLGAIL